MGTNTVLCRMNYDDSLLKKKKKESKTIAYGSVFCSLKTTWFWWPIYLMFCFLWTSSLKISSILEDWRPEKLYNVFSSFGWKSTYLNVKMNLLSELVVWEWCCSSPNNIGLVQSIWCFYNFICLTGIFSCKWTNSRNYHSVLMNFCAWRPFRVYLTYLSPSSLDGHNQITGIALGLL